jgi:hypothetical protein
MTKNPNIRWDLDTLIKLPSGHRIIQSGRADNHADESRWAIFDASGTTPDTTDDGVLWLDMARNLSASTRHAPTVPVLDQDDRPFSTPVDTPTILFLAKHFGWLVADEVRDLYYTVS